VSLQYYCILEEVADVSKEVEILFRVSGVGYLGFHLGLCAMQRMPKLRLAIPHVGNEGYHYGSDFCATLDSVDYVVGSVFTLNSRFVFGGEVVSQALL